MNDQIFRNKSMAKVSSPEQLNDYVRVSNPSVWLILAAVVILLIGVCVWGVFGRLDSSIPTAGVCEGKSLVCYIKESDFSKIKDEVIIAVDGNEYTKADIAASPVKLPEDTDEWLMHLGGFSAGEWVYEITAQTELSDGIYEASVITDRISPVTFVLN